ncbi:phosphoribosylglycinamide formyltransferase [Sphaerothrix gracilis]|uniref:phosphoribosylglycinamide formyltransferase n=1 Tax=Sphaerothrix gracilis TaxID=3151835 RepID=UPI0031FCCD3A
MSPDGVNISIVSPLPEWLLAAQPQQLRLGVMASGNGSNLEAIAEAIASGQLNAKIQVLIYNNPAAKVAQRAERWGIPAVLLDHRAFPSRELLDAAIIQTLLECEADWVIMAGWMRRVTQVLIEAFPQRILNIHPSLLPSFPGMRAVEQAIAAGVKISGCTVHLVELAVDSGPIVMQAAVPVLPADTAATLQARIQQQEHRIYPPAIALAAQQLSDGSEDSSLF